MYKIPRTFPEAVGILEELASSVQSQLYINHVVAPGPRSTPVQPSSKRARGASAHRGHGRVFFEEAVDDVLQQLVRPQRLPRDGVLDHEVGEFLHVP